MIKLLVSLLFSAIMVLPEIIIVTVHGVEDISIADLISKLIHEGTYFYAQNEFDKALDAFQKVLVLDSNNTYACAILQQWKRTRSHIVF